MFLEGESEGEPLILWANSQRWGPKLFPSWGWGTDWSVHLIKEIPQLPIRGYGRLGATLEALATFRQQGSFVGEFGKTSPSIPYVSAYGTTSSFFFTIHPWRILSCPKPAF